MVTRFDGRGTYLALVAAAMNWFMVRLAVKALSRNHSFIRSLAPSDLGGGGDDLVGGAVGDGDGAVGLSCCF
jgi:hypothetical protein